MVISICDIQSYKPMNPIISICASQCTGTGHCRLSRSTKGWGCRFLSTPIDYFPETEKDKARLFSKVYREAKNKGVLECPNYRSMFIDEVLESLVLD